LSPDSSTVCAPAPQVSRLLPDTVAREQPARAGAAAKGAGDRVSCPAQTRELLLDDPNQIEPPPSFVALFTTPSGQRLTQPMAVVRARYELCEDLAQTLTDRAATRQFQSGGSEREVLQKMQHALSGEESPVQPAEAVWVIRRLAELLDWPQPLPE
jgi:hypothetical protein